MLFSIQASEIRIPNAVNRDRKPISNDRSVFIASRTYKYNKNSVKTFSNKYLLHCRATFEKSCVNVYVELINCLNVPLMLK